MGTSTKRPKSKSGQSAGKQTSGKPGANQQASGAAKTTPDAAVSTSKTTTNAASGAKTKPVTTGAKASTGPASATVVSKAAQTPARPPSGRLQTNKRDQKREARREEFSRKIEERRQQRERERRNRTLKRWALFGLPSVAAVVIVGILLYNTFFGPQVAPYLRGAPIDGISCDSLEGQVTHYHAHLQIYVNGQQVPIPGDVGRQSITPCFYWLHVHSDTGDEGVIHIESPNKNTFDLRQFFDIWGQTLSATNLLGHKVDAAHKLTVYVYATDQQPSDPSQPFTVTPPNDLKPYTDDPAKIPLKAHELIVLEYGTPLVPPPAWSFLPNE
ncbi:MAG TPA: hypothetical protein VH599_16750 [Ktedonobacterales bacterium]|jgi:hypothetical protein